MSLSEKLIVAAKKGNAREVRKLLGRGALFTKDQFGNTALHEAAWNGNRDIVKSLLGAFCFVDSINHTGFTALHLASQNGHMKVVKTLLKWRADPSLLNQHGETALHLVAKYNHPGVLSPFGAFKISMNLKGKDGNTALHISAKLGNSEVMKSLLQHGADPTLLDMFGQSALDLTQAGNYKECSKLLRSALSKWKPKTSSGASNHYTDELVPAQIRRAETCSSSSSAAKTASKVRLLKSKTGAKHYSFSKDKRHKSGYFSEDESYSSQVPGRSCFISSHEVPNGFSYGSTSGVGKKQEFLKRPREASPAQSKSASIDQLLCEIEREYYGPGYRFSPPEDDPNGLISPYAEIHQLEVPHSQASHQNFRTAGGWVNYDFLRPSGPMEKYDNLNLKPSLGTSSASSSPGHAHFHQHNNNNGGSSSRGGSSGPPLARQTHRGKGKSSALSRHSKSPSKSPHESPARSYRKSFPHGHAPTREELVKAAVVDDTDTYVYMAPVNDLHGGVAAGHMMAAADVDLEMLGSDGEGSLQLRDTEESSSSLNGSESGSRNSKKTVICNSPLEVDRRHEPNSGLEPVKGILSQSSVNESDKSHLEQYLQEELETMRQAFQIRLGQLEKRYRRQLVLEQQRHHSKPQAPPSSKVILLRKKQHINEQTNASERRNSWHSYISSEQELDKLAEPDGPRSGSSLGIDSDHSVEGSDVEETWDEQEEEEEEGRSVGTDTSDCESSANELPESLRDSSQTGPFDRVMHSTPAKPADEVGLKGGAKSWRGDDAAKETPKMSPVSNELGREGAAADIDDDAKALIQKKIEEYREKMMQFFQEKSEAQIGVIEEKYQKQMDEVRKRYNEEANEKVSHLTTRIKDLENMLDVQTLV